MPGYPLRMAFGGAKASKVPHQQYRGTLRLGASWVGPSASTCIGGMCVSAPIRKSRHLWRGGVTAIQGLMSPFSGQRRPEILIIVSLMTQLLIYSGFKEARVATYVVWFLSCAWFFVFLALWVLFAWLFGCSVLCVFDCLVT